MQVKSLAQPTIRLFPPLWSWQNVLSILLSLAGSIFPASAFAARTNASTDPIDKDVRYVNCSSSNTLINSINTVLASLDPSEDNTIYVNGACKENVNITGYDRLQLIGQNGASITDASDGAAAVVSITDSSHASLRGFIIKGSGPNDQNDGIDCVASICSFSGNTVQSAADGVDVLQGARAFFNGDVIQNNGRGMNVGTGAFALANGMTIQMNAGPGVIVQASATFRINTSTVQNNGLGISIRLNGTTIVSQTTITGNLNDGIRVINHSTLVVGSPGDATGNTITGNGRFGILVQDLSFAQFTDLTPNVPNVVNGNSSGTDVKCLPQFPATRGALTNIGGGKTNCVEP